SRSAAVFCRCSVLSFRSEARPRSPSRGILPSTHLAREGRMTVTIGRRELLAALGGAAASWPRARPADRSAAIRYAAPTGVIAGVRDAVWSIRAARVY